MPLTAGRYRLPPSVTDVAGKADLVGGNEFSGDQSGVFLDRGGAAYNSALFASLDALLIEIGAAEATILLAPGDTKTLTANTTIPASVTLDGRMGVIATNGFDLTVNGPLVAGLWQVFDVSGGGNVTLANAEHVRPEWVGAAADNASDNYAALVAAAGIATRSDTGLQLARGRYRYATALALTDVAFVRGVPEETFLLPTSAVVGPCLSLATTDQLATGIPRALHLADLEISGSLTTGQVGLLVGDSAASATSARINLDRVTVSYFAGSGGVGVQVADVVQPVFTACRITRNETNVLHRATVASLPTLPVYNDCYINYATGVGVQIENGYDAQWNGGVIESNGTNAVTITVAAGEQIRGVHFNRTWFENNWTTLSGTPATRALAYSVDIDSTLAAGAVRGVTFDRCRIAEDSLFLTADSAQSVHITSPDLEGVPGNGTFAVTNMTGGLFLVGIVGSSPFDLVSWVASNSPVIVDGWIIHRVTPFAPGTIADGAQYENGVSMKGAVLGAPAMAGVAVDLTGMRAWAEVSAANAVTFYIRNDTGGPITPASSTLYLRVARQW